MENDNDKTRTHVILTKGTMVSHYRIAEKIGAGGMGEVYLAEDTKLNRKVALKFLPPHLCQDDDCRKRFTREAQATAKLSHPNIIHVYEVSEFHGRPFFAMEHVEGRSLKNYASDKELSIEKILELGIQMCEGLNDAHEKGVIHRDIKPSNVLIDLHGRVKIVDFGLASVVGIDQLTKTGSTLGTIGYMSPEQVLGKPVDHRSDLFSLGIVFYELITKLNPFKRDSEAATLKAVSDDTPEPLARFKSGLPDGLQAIIDKALEKDVRTRYQHADGMQSDLTRIKRSLESGQSEISISSADRHSMRTWSVAGALIVVAAVIVVMLTKPWLTSTADDHPYNIKLAVLPFENLGDPEDEYFSDGITEELTSRLSSVDYLGVISRTSAYAFKHTDASLPEIAQQLRVDYILEGSIRWDRSTEVDRIRVTAQLIRVADDIHLWSDTYDRPLTQIFTVQTEISERIVGEMGITLGTGENRKLNRRGTDDMEAYRDFLKGIHFMGKQTVEGFRLGREYLMSALDRDSTFAQAWAALSAYHTFALMTGGVSAEEAYPRARAAAEKALECDNSLAEGHIAMGWVHAQMEWDWTNAEREFRHAVDISPGYSMSYLAYATLLLTMQRHEEAIARAEVALELDPLSPFVNQTLGWVYLLCDRPDRAISQLRGTLEIDPLHVWARAQLAWSYAAEDMYPEALAQCDTVLNVHKPEFDPWLFSTLSSIYAQAGDPAPARQTLRQLTEVSHSTFIDPINFACLHANLGDTDLALKWLDRALDVRSPNLMDLRGSSSKQRLFFQNVISHPRYVNLMEKLESSIIKQGY